MIVMKRFVVGIILLAAAPAFGADLYYAFTAGFDANPGTEAQPRKTLSKFYNDLQAARCGDNFYLKKGENWSGTSSTTKLRVANKVCTAATPITITSYGSGARPIIDGTAVKRQQGSEIHASAFIVISGLQIRNWTSFSVVGSTDITINDNELNHSNKEGLHILRLVRNRNTPVSARVTVSNNIIHDCATGTTNNGECIYVGTDTRQTRDGGPDLTNNITITSNEIYNTRGEGIEFKEGVTDSTVEYNYIHDTPTVAGNTQDGAIAIGSGARNAIVRYNRVTSNTGLTYGAIYHKGSGAIYGNEVYSNTGVGIRAEDRSKHGIALDVYDNRVYQNTAGCIIISGTNVKSWNNICANNGSN